MGRRTPWEERRAAVDAGAAMSVMEQGATAAGLAWPPVAWDSLVPAAPMGLTGQHEALARPAGEPCVGTAVSIPVGAAQASPAQAIRERLTYSPFLMAPMAGVTDAAYRLMARAGGAGLAYSEMVSVTGIHYKSDKTWELVDPNPAEPELAVQLFGADVEHFREAVPQVCERLGERLSLIDVNMACPVPKVTKAGAGSAMLDTPELAADVVRAIREELDACGCAATPVTAKIRIGRVPGAIVGPEFAQQLEAAGAAAVAVHGRFASQMYRGESDVEQVARVVDAVRVPVIASGDALDPTRAARLLEDAGATGCFIARGSYGNPWIFSNAQLVHAGEAPHEVTAQMRLAAFRLHVRLLEATGAHLARARSLAGWYLRGVPEAAAWRERAMHCDGLQDYLALADELEASLG